MSVNIDLYEDTGAVLSGRGTTVTLLDSWDLKNSADHAYVYYPTNETTAAPLIRPFNTAGAQTLSFKKYLSFKLDGTYTRLKNIRIKVTASDPDTDAAQLFYKLTNTYQVPDNTFDGDMILLSPNSTILTPIIWPMLSTTGPQNATSRQTVYGPNQTLYTQFLVVQMRVNNNCVIGNSAEFNLRLEAYDYA